MAGVFGALLELCPVREGLGGACGGLRGLLDLLVRESMTTVGSSDDSSFCTNVLDLKLERCATDFACSACSCLRVRCACSGGSGAGRFGFLHLPFDSVAVKYNISTTLNLHLPIISLE